MTPSKLEKRPAPLILLTAVQFLQDVILLKGKLVVELFKEN